MSYTLLYLVLQLLVIGISFVLFRNKKFNIVNFVLLVSLQILLNIAILLDGDSRALGGVLVFSVFFLLLNFIIELLIRNQQFSLKALTRILVFVVMFLSACFTSFYLLIELYPKNQAW